MAASTTNPATDTAKRTISAILATTPVDHVAEARAKFGRDFFPLNYRHFSAVQDEMARLGFREASIDEVADDAGFSLAFRLGDPKRVCFHCGTSGYWIARFVRGDLMRRYVVCQGCLDAERA
jgi:hypothetical protein